MPYSVTDLTNDLCIVSSGRLPAPQEVPYNIRMTLRRDRHLAATFCICNAFVPFLWNASPKDL